MEALALDYDQIPLSEIDPADIRRVIITNRGGTVTIKTDPKSIRQFWSQHPSLALEERPEWTGYTTRTVGRYVSVCVEMR